MSRDTRYLDSTDDWFVASNPAPSNGEPAADLMDARGNGHVLERPASHDAWDSSTRQAVNWLEELDSDLRNDWEAEKLRSSGAWSKAKRATHAAWIRMVNALSGSSRRSQHSVDGRSRRRVYH